MPQKPPRVITPEHIQSRRNLMRALGQREGDFPLSRGFESISITVHSKLESEPGQIIVLKKEELTDPREIHAYTNYERFMSVIRAGGGLTPSEYTELEAAGKILWFTAKRKAGEELTPVDRNELEAAAKLLTHLPSSLPPLPLSSDTLNPGP